MGMVLVCAPAEADRALEALADSFAGAPPCLIGEIIPWDGAGAQVLL
jgi:hypothetical protein